MCSPRWRRWPPKNWTSDREQVRMMPPATGLSPDEGITAGSLSIQHSGAALRLVCAEAGAATWPSPRTGSACAQEKLVADGRIIGADGRATSYWELADETVLDRPATGGCQPKPASGYRVVGTAWPGSTCRTSSPAGPATPRTVIRTACLRPGRPAARARRDAGRPETAAGAGAARRGRGGAGRRLPRRGRRARRGRAARRRPAPRRRQLGEPPDAAGRGRPAGLPGLGAHCRHHGRSARRGRAPGQAPPVRSVPCAGDVPPALPRARLPRAVQRHRPGQRPGDWNRPADCRSGRTPRECYTLRGEIARALGIAAGDNHGDPRGGRGLLRPQRRRRRRAGRRPARLGRPGQPVQVVWTRADELGWAPFGAAAVVRISAETDQAEDVLSWRHEIWGNGHFDPARHRTPSVALLGGRSLRGRAGNRGRRGTAAGPRRRRRPQCRARATTFPRTRWSTTAAEMPLRTSALRSLGAFLNVFAAESFMDELAAVRRDPVEYRLSLT